MIFHFLTFLEGLAISFGLIVAIGIQSGYVLRQGIMRNHIFIVALICSLSDALLIILGVNGLGELWSSSDLLLKIFNYGGILFLYGYGIKSFISAFKVNCLVMFNEIVKPSLTNVIVTTLAVSWLNPHAYLDTCIFMSSIASNFDTELRPSFVIGAVGASFIWFFSLGYGAGYFRHFFESPKAWKILDIIIGCIMFIIASSLLHSIL